MKYSPKLLLVLLEGVIISALSALLVISNLHKKSMGQMLDSIQVEDSVLKERQQDMDGLLYIHNYILFTKDTDAYKEMSINFYGADNLAYSIYMADHCDYPLACYNVYEEISRMMENTTDLELRKEASQLAVRYLKKGAMLGDGLCAFNLACMYIKGNYVQQDTILGRKYLEQAFGSPKNMEHLYKEIKNSQTSCF